MKLFTTRQIADIDKYTIENEPISDIDLMERAARAITSALLKKMHPYNEIQLFAGPGNNGGDAMAVARMLAGEGCSCTLHLPDTGRALQGSPGINWQRLKEQNRVELKRITSPEDFPVLEKGMMVVDGLYGSGLTRPLEGISAALVRHINHSACDVFAIDIPSGLMGEDNSLNDPENIIRARTTLTLQFPKISLLFPENEVFAGEVKIIDIGLHPKAIESVETPYQLTGRNLVATMLPRRAVFSHKGTYGHALLIAGSYGKTGAALLASGACLRSGAGLVTTHLPACGYALQQTYTPEVMCSIDENEHYFTSVPSLEKYSAIGAGPGLGTHPHTQSALLQLMKECRVPLVLDADALNILSITKEWPCLLPENTILTPHPGEFVRLFGETENSWKRMELQRESAVKHKIIIVLKGAKTAIASPDGSLLFNPTGNPGMATAGSGDVLTGIILGLLAQGIPPARAAVAGVYLHGLAGDKAARKLSEPAVIASDITQFLTRAFISIKRSKKQEN